VNGYVSRTMTSCSNDSLGKLTAPLKERNFRRAAFRVPADLARTKVDFLFHLSKNKKRHSPTKGWIDNGVLVAGLHQPHPSVSLTEARRKDSHSGI